MHTRPITRGLQRQGRTICGILGKDLFYTLIRWTGDLLKEVRGATLKDTQYQAGIASLSDSSDASDHQSGQESSYLQRRAMSTAGRHLPTEHGGICATRNWIDTSIAGRKAITTATDAYHADLGTARKWSPSVDTLQHSGCQTANETQGALTEADYKQRVN